MFVRAGLFFPLGKPHRLPFPMGCAHFASKKKTSSDSVPLLADFDQPVKPCKNPLFQLVQTTDQLNEALNELEQAPYFSFDTETTGLHIIEDKPIGISFSLGNQRASYYIPFFEGHLRQPQLLSASDTVSAIRTFFNLTEKNLKIAHNVKFDIQMLRNVGIHVKGDIYDTMIAGFLLDSREPIGLDAMSLKWLNIAKIPTTELIGKRKNVSMTEAPLELLTEYACEDALCTYLLYERLDKELGKDPQLYSFFKNHEMPVAKILAQMEQAGVHVDRTLLNGISTHISKEIEQAKSRIFQAANGEFNLNSTKQLFEVLVTKLDVPGQCNVELKKESPKTGQKSLDITVLKSLDMHPVVKDVIQYRSLSKLLTTVESLPKLITSSTHRIHPSFNQCGTRTGRLSCSKPNLQNVPIRTELGKQIRSAFCAKSPDHRIIAADYSQIELRIVAFLARDKNLTKIFVDRGDVHQSTAAVMFKKDLESVTKEDRSRAKAINYGIIYGMGPNRLATSTGVSLHEAKQFIKQYFLGFPQMKAFFDSNLMGAEKSGFVRTHLGRKRPVDFQGTSKEKSHNKNVCGNTPIQGTAADLITTAMIQIDRELGPSKLDGEMLLQVHDELVFECAAKDEEQMKALILNGMVRGEMNLGDVPIEVDIRSGMNWMEAH